MNNEPMHQKRSENVFRSGFVWLLTCVIVAISPIFISCLFHFITENDTLSATLFFYRYLRPHLKDILLIGVSVACGLMSLSLDRSKYIKRGVKQAGLIIAAVTLTYSCLLYFFIDGKGSNQIKHNTWLLHICMLFILLCSIIGYYIENKHEKYTNEIESQR